MRPIIGILAEVDAERAARVQRKRITYNESVAKGKINDG